MKRIAALLLFAAAVAVFFIGQPGVDKRAAKMAGELDAEIASRAYHIDAAELLELMHTNQSRLVILDVRDEADYNVFHLHDARRLPAGDKGVRAARRIPADAIKVLVDSNEQTADVVWKRLAALGTPNVYILEGGVDKWLDLFARYQGQNGPTAFVAALGSRTPAAFPEAGAFVGREFTKKVTAVKAVVAPTGGCGG